MMMSVKRAFVDTNVMLRTLTKTANDHEAARALVLDYQAQGYQLFISRQVIREYLVQVTRPQTYSQPLTYQELQTKMRVINRLFIVLDDTESVTLQLLLLLRDYPTQGKQVHDASIVATMLVNGVDTLLTTNLSDMKRFAPLIKLDTP